MIVLWALGFLGGYVVGWYIHLLLAIAVILFLMRVIQGRNPLK